ncbi:MAG: ABC transporter substrate-binding protein [Chloroflexi bacterium]|nr:ABC transporter substrate-binding protein [Chloroflexota bacterium]
MVGLIVLSVSACAGTPPAATPSPKAGSVKPTISPAPTESPTSPVPTKSAVRASPPAPKPSGKQPVGEPIRLGAILALSGPASNIGVAERDSLMLLEDIINGKDGVRGRPVKFIVYDSGGDEGQAVEAARKLIEEDEVVAIIGPSTDAEALAMVDAVEKGRITNVSLASAAQLVRPVRPWIFKLAQHTGLLIGAAMNHMGHNSISRLALLTEVSSYGDLAKAEFERNATFYGLVVVASERFSERDTAQTAQLTGVRVRAPQALALWGASEGVVAGVRSARRLGMGLPIYVSDLFATPAFLAAAGDAASDVLAPASAIQLYQQLPDSHPQKSITRELVEAFKSRYDRQPDYYVGLAFDSAQIVLRGIEEVGTDRRRIRDAVEGTVGYVGVTGIYNMTPEDHLGLAPWNVMMSIVKEGKFMLAQ